MGVQRRVAVVGGGVSGLATAYYLTHREPGDALFSREPRCEVTLLEASPRLGGKIRTAEVAGLGIDTGPDAILARSGVVEGLLRELGLVDVLSRPTLRRAYVWTRGELRPLPPSSLFGVPDTPLPLLRSRVLSPWGALRAGADFVLPRKALPPDPTIAQLLRPRFGREVFDQLVEPMLGGVHAGRADVLSARSAVPEVYVAARANRSTYLALRRRGEVSPRPGGLGMVTVQGGLTRLVEALVAALGDARLRTQAQVTAVERSGGGYRLRIGGGVPGVGVPGGGDVPSAVAAGDAADAGEVLDVDAVVLATPAYHSADLLAALSPQAATALAGIPYVGVATVTLAYPRATVRRQLDGTGFLVPPKEGRFLVGCTWSTSKWPHLADPDVAVFRCSVGRHGDQRWADLGDAELIDRVHAEVAEAVGLSAAPSVAHLQRWPAAMPQYTVGHEHRLVSLATALRRVPGVHVTGAAYRGVGIASCVTHAAGVAGAVMAGLRGGEPAAAHSGDTLGASR